MKDFLESITREQYEDLFLKMHPGYFEREYVRAVPEDEPASEMLLSLKDFDEDIYVRSFDGDIRFGYYDGDPDKLREKVAMVVPHWTQFFEDDSRVYCGYIGGNVASFCLIEDFGEHTLNGRKLSIGGPGCVGTLPESRDRGIGLSMVRDVTKILRDEQYDLSYIHYTYETAWYGKLGYRTFVSWTGKGFV